MEELRKLLGKRVWWLNALGERCEDTINCFYIEQGINGFEWSY